jgi:hypothetical protein
MNARYLLFCAALALSVGAMAQSTGSLSPQHTPIKTAASTRGTLSGRVFAITQGGDLKPARMADVYILFSAGVTRDGKAVDVGETADLVFMGAHNDLQEQYIKEFQANPQWSEKMACIKDLATFRPAMIKTMDWAEAKNKSSQIVKTQSDEDGNFSASLPPGKYHVLVRGRAGFNEGLWDSGLENVDIHPGSHAEIKLSSPDKSCLDVPD